MQRKELEILFFKRELFSWKALILFAIGSFVTFCGFMAFALFDFGGLWITNAIVGQKAADGTIWWLVHPDNLTLIDANSVTGILLSAIVIFLGIAICCGVTAGICINAKTKLLRKECEDYHEYLASKDLEQDFNKYLIGNKLAYDEELDWWRETSPELKARIPFQRKIKLP